MKQTDEKRKRITVSMKDNGVHIIGMPCMKVPSLSDVYFLDVSGENYDIATTLYVGDKIKIGDDVWVFTTLTLTKKGTKIAYFNVHDENGKRIKSFFVNNGEVYLLSLNQAAIDKYGIIEKVKDRYALKTCFVEGLHTIK